MTITSLDGYRWLKNDIEIPRKKEEDEREVFH